MPKTFSIGEVLAVLRQRLALTREEGLVLFANEKHMIKPSSKLEEVYAKYADQDGFLYLVYAEENIYGWNAQSTVLQIRDYENSEKLPEKNI